MIFGVILSVFLFFTREYIARIYTNDPIVKENLKNMLIVYYVIYFSELTLPTVNTVMKSLDKNMFVLTMNFLIVFCGSVGIGYYLGWVVKWKGISFIISFCVSITVLTQYLIYYLNHVYNWNQLKKNDLEAEKMGFLELKDLGKASAHEESVRNSFNKI